MCSLMTNPLSKNAIDRIVYSTNSTWFLDGITSLSAFLQICSEKFSTEYSNQSLIHCIITQ